MSMGQEILPRAAHRRTPTNETDLAAWRYFASKEYQSGSTFPRSDCAPRLWIANRSTADTTWSW